MLLLPTAFKSLIRGHPVAFSKDADAVFPQASPHFKQHPPKRFGELRESDGISYSLWVPPESFLAVRYFIEIASTLLDMVTTPKPLTCRLNVWLLRQPKAGELASCRTSRRSLENR